MNPNAPLSTLSKAILIVPYPDIITTFVNNPISSTDFNKSIPE
jgi:hypothetical protein